MRLVKTQFSAWLKAKPPAEIVGKKRDCSGCPIAHFYAEASGGYEVVIFDDGEGYRIDRGYSKRPLPSWAADFVFAIDADGNAQISAQRALQVLNRR